MPTFNRFPSLIFCVLISLALGLMPGCGGREQVRLGPPEPFSEAELERNQARYGELEGLLRERETITRVGLLADHLQERGQGDVGAVAELLQSQAIGIGQVEAALLVRFWTTYAPEAAAQWAMSSKVSVDLRLTVLCTMVEAWASFDPEGVRPVVAQYLIYPSELVPPAILVAYVKGWYASGQPGLIAYLKGLEPSTARSRSLTEYTRQNLGKNGFDLTAQALLDYPRDDYRFRSLLWRQAAPELMRNDRTKALEFCAAHCDKFEGTFVRQNIARQWMLEDDVNRVEVMEWLSAAPAGRELNNSLRVASEIWEERDNAGLSEWGYVLLDSEVEPWHSAALPAVVRSLSRTDLPAALALAQNIQPQSLRETSLVRSGRLFFEQDPEAAEAWIETADLTPGLKARIRQLPLPGSDSGEDAQRTEPGAFRVERP